MLDFPVKSLICCQPQNSRTTEAASPLAALGGMLSRGMSCVGVVVVK